MDQDCDRLWESHSAITAPSGMIDSTTGPARVSGREVSRGRSSDGVGKTNACGGNPIRKLGPSRCLQNHCDEIHLFYHFTSTSEGACAGIELPKVSFVLR